MSDYFYPQFTNLDNYYYQIVKNDKTFIRYFYSNKYITPKYEEKIPNETVLFEIKSNYVKITDLQFSKYNTHCAFGVDTNGDENYTLYLLNLSTNQLQKINDTNISDNFLFINDVLYYVQFDDTYRNYRIKSLDGDILFIENNPLYSVSIFPDVEDKGIIISVNSYSNTEFIHYSTLYGFRYIIKKEQNLICFVDYSWEHKLVYISIYNKGFAEIPEDIFFYKGSFDKKWNKYKVFNGIVEDFITKGKDTLILSRDTISGIQKLWKYSGLKLINIKTDNFIAEYLLPGQFKQDRRNKQVLFIEHTNGKTPKNIIELNFITGKIINTFNNPYIKKENLFIKHKLIDGIPTTFMTKDKNKNILFMAYGAYGVVYNLKYQEWIVNLCKNGWNICVIHCRGGGEKGLQWYLDGKLLKKMNTITDCVNVVKHISKEYNKVAIYGRSAGGISVGATINEIPEYFDYAIMEVPFVNILETMSNPSANLTIGEYLEFGNPNDNIRIKKLMTSYDPVLNIKKNVKYPKILLTSGKNDPRVNYEEHNIYYKQMKKINPKTKINLIFEKYGHFGFTNKKDKLKSDNNKIKWLK